MKPLKIKQRPFKYNAIKTTVDGITFHSKAEAYRYKSLKVLEKAGYIKNLDLQVKMPYTHNGDIIFNYYADFTYYRDGMFIIEDVKGMRTPLYRLKKKLIEAYYRITITEVE